MKPRKHAELIKAWADGAEVEYRHSPEHEWYATSTPMWGDDGEYRIKPNPVISYEVTVTARTRNGENFIVSEFHTPPGEALKVGGLHEPFSLYFFHARKE